MTHFELNCLCSLLMYADPFPLSEKAEKALKDYANRISRQMGFIDWVDAYHQLP